MKLVSFVLRYVCQTLYQIVVLLDHLANILIGGDGGETISSRMGKGRRAGKPNHMHFADGIDFFFAMTFNDHDHCEKSIIWITHRAERSFSALWNKIMHGIEPQPQRHPQFCDHDELTEARHE